MKNQLLLIVAALILVSCGVSNEQKKFDLNQEMHQLIMRMNQNGKQKTALKQELEKMYFEYNLKQEKSGNQYVGLSDDFIKEIDKIDRQQRKLEKQVLLDEMNFRRLEQEYY